MVLGPRKLLRELVREVAFFIGCSETQKIPRTFSKKTTNMRSGRGVTENPCLVNLLVFLFATHPYFRGYLEKIPVNGGFGNPT